MDKAGGGAAVRASAQAQQARLFLGMDAISSFQIVNREPVNIRIEEKLTAQVSRDGGLNSADVSSRSSSLPL